MKREIRVTGRGKLSVKPDMIRIRLTSSRLMKEYHMAVNRSAEDTRLLRKAVEYAGLDPKSLKTSYFNVDTEYRSRKYNDTWRDVFAGYRYTHRMYIAFDNDNEILSKVLTQLAECGVDVNFSIEHTVKDPEKARKELLAITIRDAKDKAELLAEASGVRLGEIVTIDYSVAHVEIYSELCEDMEIQSMKPGMKLSNSISMDIEADDIDIHDNATVVWNIA